MATAKKTGRVLTVEENALQGGFGSALLEFLYEHGLQHIKVHRLGIPDDFIEHGSQTQLRQNIGIDSTGITNSAIQFLKQ